jgi:hypothetical protein
VKPRTASGFWVKPRTASGFWVKPKNVSEFGVEPRMVSEFGFKPRAASEFRGFTLLSIRGAKCFFNFRNMKQHSARITSEV